MNVSFPGGCLQQMMQTSNFLSNWSIIVPSVDRIFYLDQKNIKTGCNGCDEENQLTLIHHMDNGSPVTMVPLTGIRVYYRCASCHRQNAAIQSTVGGSVSTSTECPRCAYTVSQVACPPCKLNQQMSRYESVKVYLSQINKVGGRFYG